MPFVSMTRIRVQVVERYSHMIEGPTLSKCHVVEFGKFDLLSFRLA